MPNVYLSPSTQEFHPYVTGSGNEEVYMNAIVDAMIPYLEASGISFERNDPSLTVSNSIARSNEGNFDLHLAIHSNASPPNVQGVFRGPNIYYYPNSEQGRQAADIIAKNMKSIYPNPELVVSVPSTTLTELRTTIAPSVVVETGYHDNWEDANWIVNHIDNIAKNLALSLTDYFGIPFVNP